MPSASPAARGTGADRYAVFGNPIAHSRSPDIHAAFAAQTGQLLTYEKILAPLDGFAAALADFIAAGGRGANVTVPFKLDAHAASRRLTARAAAAGAVNTLLLDNGQIIGDNTDGIGLVTDLSINAGIDIDSKRVLLLGGGGAAQGVVLPLLQARPAQLVIANRTVTKAEAIVARLAEHHAGVTALSASSLAQLTAPFDIIINATAASLSNAVPEMSAQVFGQECFAYDMMYAHAPTPFMAHAARHGAAVRDGLGMLVEQAAEAFHVWRGVRPATADVLARLRVEI